MLLALQDSGREGCVGWERVEATSRDQTHHHHHPPPIVTSGQAGSQALSCGHSAQAAASSTGQPKADLLALAVAASGREGWAPAWAESGPRAGRLWQVQCGIADSRWERMNVHTHHVPSGTQGWLAGGSSSDMPKQHRVH